MIVVTGSTGQLGTALRRLLDDTARYLDESELDLTDADSIRPALTSLRPSALINCAAYTDVDRAESELGVAEAVNATAVGIMAETMVNLGGRFVTFSTDYVFDGASDRPYVESDTPNPINVYGRTKRQGEVEAITANPDSLVIRTSWLLSGTHQNFVTTMIRLAWNREVTVVDDQYGHPTFAADLARTTLSALQSGASGILHLTNAGVTSWYGLARDIVECADLDPDRIRSCTTADYPTSARRPAHSVIDSERLGELGLEPLPPYSVGLEQAVAEALTWLR